MNVVSALSGDLALARPAHERAVLRRACEAFEALLVQSLLRAMREAQLEEGFFGEGAAGRSTYEGIFEQQLAEHLAAGSPLGLARKLEADWSRRLDAGNRAAQVAARDADGT